ncbi:MAG: glycosyltransferase family 4 protein [Pseudomonadota bacterium]
MRVIHCLRSPVGGLFRHVRDLATGQAARGHQVGIICDANTGGAQADTALEQLGRACELGILRTDMGRIPGPADIGAYRTISRHVRASRPQIIHGHGAKGGAFARLCASAEGPLAIYTPHGGSLHYSGKSASGALFLGLEKLLKPRTAGFVFVAQFEQAAFTTKVGSYAGQDVIVHNGLNAEELVPVEPEPDADDFGFIGELRELKGVDLVIKGLAAVNEHRPATAVFAGSGSQETELRKLAQAVGVEGKITFAGHQPARKLFAMARNIILPSRAESFPYAVLEAAGAKRPLITTNVGGIPEIFGPQKDLLLPPDAEAAVARAMRQALQDPARHLSQAETLHARIAREFNVDVMVDKISAFYDTVLAAHNSAEIRQKSAA